MALTFNDNISLGSKIEHFILPDLNGTELNSMDILESSEKGLIVSFICNHCPYVKHVIDRFSETAREYDKKGIKTLMIMSNDYIQYPDDAPDKMKSFAKDHRFEFPYLLDETQEVAKKFKAKCTPDTYLFDKAGTLYYHGRLDSASPGNSNPVTCSELIAAMDQLIDGETSPEKQYPSMGCSIKWKD